MKCPFFLLYRLYGGANSARSSRKLFVAYFVAARCIWLESRKLLKQTRCFVSFLPKLIRRLFVSVVFSGLACDVTC